MADGPGRKASRSTLRRAGLAVLVLAAIAVVGYLAVAVLLHAVADPERLARWTEQRLETSLDRDVAVGSVHLGVFPRLEVDVRNLRIDNPPEFEAPPFAEIDRVRLGVALLPLLRRRVEVDEAGASGAVVRLRVTEDGRSNYGDLVPAEGEEEAAPEGSAPLRVEVGHARVEGMSVSYRNDSTGLRAAAEELDGEASLGEPSDDGGRALELDLEGSGLSASGLPGGGALSSRTGGLRLRGETGPDYRWLRIREGEIRLDPVGVGVEGRVDSLRSPVRHLELAIVSRSVAVADLAELAEDLTGGRAAGAGEPSGAAPPSALDSLRPAGTVALDLQVRGPLGPERVPEVAGTATLQDGRLGAPGRPPLADELAGEVRIATDSLRLARLGGRLLDGTLEASGAVALDSPRAYRLSVRSAPQLETLPRAVPGLAAEPELSGSVQLDLAVRGRAGSVAATRATGTARPAAVRVRREGWAGELALPGGTLRLTGDGLVGEALPVVAAGDTLQADLEMTGLFTSRAPDAAVPELTGEVRGGRLDLDALLGREAADSVTYGGLVFARLGGRPVAGRAPEELAGEEGFRRPTSSPVRGTLRAVLGRVDWGPYRLEDVDLLARLAPDRLEVTRARLTTFGGRATGSFSLDLVPGPAAPFSLEMAIEEARAADLLATLTPLGRLATGTTSLSVATSGRLDTLLLPLPSGLSGDGRMEATDGQIRENPVTSALASTLSLPALRSPGFRAWTFPFEIRADTLRLPPGQLTGGPVPVDFAGRIGFGGALGLAATVGLPRQAASSLADQVGGLPSALLRRVAGGEGAVPVGLSLGGTVSEPRVTVEVDALRQALQSAVREEARSEVEERATGLLRRLLPGRSDTAPADTAGAPPDSAGDGTP